MGVRKSTLLFSPPELQPIPITMWLLTSSCINEVGLFIGMYHYYPEPLRLAADSKNRYRTMYGYLRTNMSYRESFNYLTNDKGVFRRDAEANSFLEESPECRFREQNVKNLLMQGAFEGV